MSDFDDQMAEWRKTLWATGPCQVSSQKNLTLTDEEREAVEWFARHSNHGMSMRRSATLRGLLERLGGGR